MFPYTVSIAIGASPGETAEKNLEVVTENAALNSRRTPRLRDHLLELDAYETVVLNWMVKKTSSRTGRLTLLRNELVVGAIRFGGLERQV